MTLAVNRTDQEKQAADVRRPGAPAPDAVRPRIQSLDILRGVVMVIMAIDHIRDFLHAGAQRFSPEDLTQTTVAIFFTRWITHFCAPVFIFLAGTSAYLALRRKAPSTIGRFLWTRGVWLIIVESTLIQFATSFNFSYNPVIWQVIWAIGWSMIALSVLRLLPWGVLLAVSLMTIAGHNMLDALQPEQFGSLGWLWKILHVGFSPIDLGGGHVAMVIYPLVPWIAVMSAGYCFGRVMELDAAKRRRVLLVVGGALTAGFVVLRIANGYGDPEPWTVQRTPIMTTLSFLRVTKYPPSLMFLLMTLGPAVVALAFLDKVSVRERNPFLVFGRVPLFFYIAHWYVLHTVALFMAWVRYGRFDFMFGFPPSLLGPAAGYPADYGYDLWVVYVAWAGIVFGLYFLCRWFARVKAQSRSVWLGYL